MSAEKKKESEKATQEDTEEKKKIQELEQTIQILQEQMDREITKNTLRDKAEFRLYLISTLKAGFDSLGEKIDKLAVEDEEVDN